MISDHIRVRNAAALPESIQQAMIGMVASKAIESRFLRSEHAKAAVIVSVRVDDATIGNHSGGKDLILQLDRPIGEPVIRSRRPDTVSLYGMWRGEYVSPLAVR